MLKKAVKSLLFILAVSVNSQILNAGQIAPAQKSGTVQPSLTTLQILTLKRVETIKGGVYGELYLEGKLICYTLENEQKKIPAGSYIISKTKRGFRLNNVPGRAYINIEAGNYPFESLGCIFVGTGRTDKGVTGSRAALLKLALAVQLPAQLTIR